MAVAIICPLALMAQGVDDLAARLRAVQCYDATVDFTVLMSIQDDVAYRVQLHSAPTPADSLSPVSYLLRWTMPKADNAAATDGFSAYFDGNLYTFTGGRMVERHAEADTLSFRGAPGTLPIQRRTRFVELLPAYIADEIEAIASSPDYSVRFTPDTIVDGRRATTLRARMVVGGVTSREVFYAFDRDTALPIVITTDNNPGALAEQTITARFLPAESPLTCTPLDEKVVRDLYPEVFDKYRENTFAITNLPGQPLPRFALPTITGERYTYTGPSQGFKAPTIIVLLDPTATLASATVEAVRSAAAGLPYNADIIWASVSNDRDTAEALIGATPMGETLLVSAKALARDCGTATFPVVILTSTDGTVADVILGYTPTLSATLLQKAAPLR